MGDLYEIWQQAEVWRKLDVLSGFVAMCVTGDEEARHRLARLIAEADAALSASPPDMEGARHELDTLVRWADAEWADHPYRPTEARPDEADRQTRDYAKDLWLSALPVVVRDEMARIELGIEVTFLALCRRPGLDPCVRQDAFYLAGRAAMALDLGHPEAAEAELCRLRQLDSAQPRQDNRG
ncbi:hypothetical protein [Streptomyces sp. NPDC002644]